jgi:L-alanine-DL-glutamate epimerase-like enolase superfamily enzyme
MARLQGVGNVKGSVKRVLVGHVVVPDGPGLGIQVSERSVRANARIMAEA